MNPGAVTISSHKKRQPSTSNKTQQTVYSFNQEKRISDSLPSVGTHLMPRQSSMYKGKLGDVGTCSTFWEPGTIKSSWIEKRGGGTYSSDWRKRFAVLNPAREILYYDDDKCDVPKGEIHIPTSATISPDGKSDLIIAAKDRRW